MKRSETMVRLVFFSMVIAAAMICMILASGCTGQSGAHQPPASTLTIPTTRPVTPAPGTSVPARTETTAGPATPAVTPAWTPGTVTQAGAAILIRGDVIGVKSPGGNFIDEIRFTVVKAPRAEPVTFEIPSTQIIFTKFDEQFGSNYIILSGDWNGDRVLDGGETFVVRVPVPPPHEIYPGQKFTMAIKNPPQPQVTVMTEAPPVLRDEPMVLAMAPP